MLKKEDVMKKAGQKTTIIYCGPSIPFVAKEGTAFQDGVPFRLTELGKQCPAIGVLLVKIDDYAETRKMLRKKSSAESILYEKAKEYIQKGVKEYGL
ncbi:hypothetical protein [Anaerotignum propionicum]|uniref:hypothetical protein n=1 Tax=Anaerotignum propionicum TaxID=28446 RepID=UPI00289E064E|nr:hypothetical protein [Anaerotignum propionicum]